MNPEVNQNQAPKYWDVVFHSVITFLGQSLMQVVDLIFCRDLGSLASATVGTATSFLAWFIILGMGLVSSLEYLIPHSLGAKNEKKAHEYFYAGLFVIALVSMVSTAGLILVAKLSPLYGMNPEIVAPVQQFCNIVSLSYLPVFLVPLFRIELQARGYPNVTTEALLYGNILNVFLNWVLVLGHLGCPALGLMGSAYANVLSRFAIFFYLFYRLYRARRGYAIQMKTRDIPIKTRAIEILKMGAPSSLHMMFEVGAFIFVGALASRLSSHENAAHAIAISIASFVFMIPAGMSSAAATTMSRALGERKRELSITLGRNTILLGLGYASLGSLIFLLARYPIVHAYTSDPDTLRMGAKLILIAAIFQFGDAMQVILAGCLRGLGETRVQATMNAIGHWLIGIPVGVVLAFHLHQGIVGLWIGLCIGLFTVAGLLYSRYQKLAKT